MRPERCWPLAVGVVRGTGTPRGGCVGGPELRHRRGVVLGRGSGLAGGVPALVRCRVRGPAGRRLYGSLRGGEHVLVHAAAGGVGIAAIQLAKAAGAVVHGTASPGKHSQLVALAIDRAIDYRRDGWWKGLEPYDIVLDPLGGTSLRRSFDLLRPGGRLVAYGLSSLQQGEKGRCAGRRRRCWRCCADSV